MQSVNEEHHLNSTFSLVLFAFAPEAAVFETVLVPFTSIYEPL